MSSVWKAEAAPVKRKRSDDEEARREKSKGKRQKHSRKESHSKCFDTCQISFYGNKLMKCI